jgi:hypothetical protein
LVSKITARIQLDWHVPTYIYIKSPDNKETYFIIYLIS